MAGHHHICRIAVLAVALLGFGSAAAAQTPISEQRVASPPLPPDHWAVEAARRAEALGLAPGFLPAQTAVPRHVIAQILLRAAESAGSDLPHMEPVASGWVRRFEEEFAGLSSPAFPQAVHNLGSSVEARVADRSGAVVPGRGIVPFGHTGAAPAAESSVAEGTLLLAAGIGSHLSVAVEPGITDDGFRVGRWEARAGWGNLGFSVGRQPIAYGYRPGSGLVLSGVEPIDRVQFETLAPFRLPGVFGRLGRISIHGFGGRLDGPRHPGDPYMWGASGSLQPHPRVTLSLNRAAIIGGDSVATPLTPRTFLRTFVGHNLLGFENEVVAGGVRVRLPTERLIPLTVYSEWGAEDAAGAWRDVPGRLYGVYVPALPGIAHAALGAEYVSFAGSCCGNPPWYRHIPHTGGWVMDEHPLGHPLGGQGRQTSVFGSAELLGARLRLNGQAFSRTREGENLFVPGREGTSTGASLAATLRVQARSDIRLDAFRESGAGWSEHAVAFGVRAFF